MQIETTLKQTLFMALELSNKKWKVAFATTAHNPRQISLQAGDRDGLPQQIAKAKGKFGLPADAPVQSCYEAGRDGFWVHRLLESLGVENLVVDSASIEVDRRARRAKTDRLDADKLVRMLIRYWGGDSRLWGVARVPSEAEEDERRLHRERERLIRERTAHRCRIRALLQLHGVRTEPKWRQLSEQLDSLRDWNDKPLPRGLQTELRREAQRLQQLEEQLAAVNKVQAQQLTKPQTAAQKQAAKLHRLRAVGPVSALVLSKEFFGGRDFRNRREVGGLSGLTGTPYDSGGSERDQGISKAGNRRVRTLMVELAWSWLRYQPQSELSQWYVRRFGSGSPRMRRVGIVALARKLLVALWKYLARDESPAGALQRA
ncbi:MAG: IS110 family transposase [Acidobacteria bacterium]|nr:IS110 family transposase [Acidobacteriota bacterium]